MGLGGAGNALIGMEYDFNEDFSSGEKLNLEIFEGTSFLRSYGLGVGYAVSTSYGKYPSDLSLFEFLGPDTQEKQYTGEGWGIANVGISFEKIESFLIWNNIEGNIGGEQ